MKRFEMGYIGIILIILPLLFSFDSAKKVDDAISSDPLPSWNETEVKQKLIAYVETAHVQIPTHGVVVKPRRCGTGICV